MRWFALLGLVLSLNSTAATDGPRSFPHGKRPDDRRLREFRTTDDSEFPMQAVASVEDWPVRREMIRTRILVAAGLHPMPKRSALNAVIHGKVERDDYTVERIIFESFPAHYVTGSLYRPRSTASSGRRPVVLCPHGHWKGGRFHDHGEDVVRREIAAGAEQFEVGGRHPIQARCVQLARMDCIVFAYDMEGYADSVQLNHSAGPRPNRGERDAHLLFSPEAEQRGQTPFGLQTWNSIRAVDFVCSLDGVDTSRIAVTGASGGGTQSMILGAVDDRVAAAFPAVMVSTAMQGGCTCENAAYLRIGQGNVDIAAAIAPRPLGLTAADDWTKELETKGHPDLISLYRLLGNPDRYEAHFHVQFKHNYNAVNRQHMYSFINRHFELGLAEPIVERDYVPLDPQVEATVWSAEHAKLEAERVGESHELRLTGRWTEASDAAFAAMTAAGRRRVIGEGIGTIVGRSPVDVGTVEWRVSSIEMGSDDCLVSTGRLVVLDYGEQLPAVLVQAATAPSGDVVILLADTGKGAALGTAGAPPPRVLALVRRGYTVVSVDMFGQGEVVEGGGALTSARIKPRGKGDKPSQHALCYTYGFNHPLFVQRVHDVMSLVEFLRNAGPVVRADRIHLVAVGAQAGPVGLVARIVLGDRVRGAAIDTQGFRFESVDRLDHPMLVPGILRYGGMDALWTLNRALGTSAVEGVDAAFESIRRGQGEQ